jgi:ABC-type bacteriocin/lantibiotic exporter with double-glycine peptidase domain
MAMNSFFEKVIFGTGYVLPLPALAVALALTSVAWAGMDAKDILKSDPKAGKILEVPFISQKRFQCGPASVAMALQYHGAEADPDRIAKRFETEAVAGTFTVDLLIAANDAGMEAHWIEGDIKALKKEIDRGRPAVVFLNLAVNPLPARHFAVAVGYLTHNGKDYVILHSGQTSWLMAPEKKFMKQWKRTGNMMMTIRPREDDGSGKGGAQEGGG